MRYAILAAAILTAAGVADSAQPLGDKYIKGYATAVLDAEFPEAETEFEVNGGVLIFSKAPADEALAEAIADRLRRIEGVRGVRMPPPPQAGGEYTWSDFDREFTGFFPREDLFDSLLADPMESRFMLSYRVDETEDRNLGAAELGDVFGLYRWHDVFGEDHHIQINMEGAVFGYFDLDAFSSELQNVDFQIGLPVVYRFRDWSTRWRVMHRSSHLGDEYLARNPDYLNGFFEKQVDQNFFDAVVSREFGWLRVYAGGLYYFDIAPDREPLEAFYGLEIAPWSDRSLHPVAGVHVQHLEEFDWGANQRFALGVEIQDWPFRHRKVRILGEYYKGQRLQLPFYRQPGDYYGVSVYFEP